MRAMQRHVVWSLQDSGEEEERAVNCLGMAELFTRLTLSSPKGITILENEDSTLAISTVFCASNPLQKGLRS